MGREINRTTSKQYMRVAHKLSDACSKANTASYDARPCFAIHGQGAEKIDCSVGYSEVVGLGLQMNGYIDAKTVPEFIGWLRDVFPEEFKKVVETE